MSKFKDFIESECTVTTDANELTLRHTASGLFAKGWPDSLPVLASMLIRQVKDSNVPGAARAAEIFDRAQSQRRRSLLARP